MIVRILMPDDAFVQVVVEVSFNGYLQLSPDQSGLDIHLCNVVVGVRCRSEIAIAQRRWMTISSREPSFVIRL